MAQSSDENSNSKQQSPSLHSPIAVMVKPSMKCHLPEGQSFLCTSSSISLIYMLYYDWVVCKILNNVSRDKQSTRPCGLATAIWAV